MADRAPLLPLTGKIKPDLVAGFLVFLIALPLCLAIAIASKYPPIAGIWTAVIGGIVCSFISNSQLTIKGPAAGLIVIVAGAVIELGGEFGQWLSEGEQLALGYRLALGIGITAGVLQMLFGLIRAGKLGDFFPLAAVHGMLASIGIIIIAKQSYVMIGAVPPKDAGPLELLSHFPTALASDFNPDIALIGVVSLLILILVPFLPSKNLRRIPAPMLALLVAVPVGMYFFHLDDKHNYTFGEATYTVGPTYLVDMPDVMEKPDDAYALPDFRGVATMTGLKYVILFALIGSLESLLSAKAIDLLDPWRRKTDMNRDLLAVGLANTLTSAIGALPMISEIVRSSANINNGAQTRKSNLFHGLFLLGFALFLPGLIHEIPLAALGAMLVYTGFRLASPREFAKTYTIGFEQLVIFVGTIIATLATDLLIGIGAGIAIKLLFHLWNGMPLRGAVRADVDVEEMADGPIVLKVHRSAVFTNWLGLKAAIDRFGGERGVLVDLSDTKLVDHSVMEKLHELEHEFARKGWAFKVVGLEAHETLSRHPNAARRKKSGESTVTPA